MDPITEISLLAMAVAGIGLLLPVAAMIRSRHAFGHSRAGWGIAATVNAVFATLNIAVNKMPLIGFANAALAIVALAALAATFRLPRSIAGPVGEGDLLTDLETAELEIVHQAVIREAKRRGRSLAPRSAA